MRVKTSARAPRLLPDYSAAAVIFLLLILSPVSRRDALFTSRVVISFANHDAELGISAIVRHCRRFYSAYAGVVAQLDELVSSRHSLERQSLQLVHVSVLGYRHCVHGIHGALGARRLVPGTSDFHHGGMSNDI